VFREGNPLPLAPYYYDWIAHPNYDAFWAKMDVETRYEDVKVPTLNIGWWYDIFQIGTVRNFQLIRSEGGTSAARKGSQLLMWAQCHACPPGTKAGEIDFGPQNQYDLNALYVRFFDRWLKGIENGIDTEPAAKLFVMVPPDSGTQGSGFWITSETFPLPSTRTVKLQLASSGHANSSSGDGVLVGAGGGGNQDGEHEGEHGNSGGGRPDKFVYDPRNPVPTKGGDMCCINDLLPSGAFDQAGIEKRGDVLVYTSPVLTKNMTVIGQVNVKLWAITSAPDTDFTAKLVDVHPDGYAQNILDRLVRARYPARLQVPPFFHRAGEGVRVLDRVGQHLDRLQGRTQDPSRDLLLQLPALRAQPEHQGGSGIEHPDADSAADHPARRRPPVASGAAGRPDQHPVAVSRGPPTSGPASRLSALPIRAQGAWTRRARSGSWRTPSAAPPGCPGA